MNSLTMPIKIQTKGCSLKRLLRKSRKASLTLEAAFLAPACLLLLLSLFWFFIVQNIETNLENALHKAGDRLAIAYARNAENESPDGEWQNLIQSAISCYAVGEIARELSADTLEGLNSLFVEGGADGVSFSRSYYDSKNRDLYLYADYSLTFPYLSFLKVRFPMTVKVMQHTWEGQKLTNKVRSETFYVTKTGTVYHLFLDCTHLALSIRKVSETELERARNESGEKYRACEYCGENESGNYYITSFGECYHTNRNCTGLKRTIYAVSREDLKGRSLCKKCAQKAGKE